MREEAEPVRRGIAGQEYTADNEHGASIDARAVFENQKRLLLHRGIAWRVARRISTGRAASCTSTARHRRAKAGARSEQLHRLGGRSGRRLLLEEGNAVRDPVG